MGRYRSRPGSPQYADMLGLDPKQRFEQSANSSRANKDLVRGLATFRIPRNRRSDPGARSGDQEWSARPQKSDYVTQRELLRVVPFALNRCAINPLTRVLPQAQS